MPRIQTIYNQLAFVRIIQATTPLFLTTYTYFSYQKNKKLEAKK